MALTTKYFASFLCLTLVYCSLPAQEGTPTGIVERALGVPQGEPVYTTFSNTRIINAHAPQTLEKRTLDFRVYHRFGDILADWSPSDAFHRWYGLDNVRDYRIGFEYGVTDRLTLAVGRSKVNETFDGHAKYWLLQQTKDDKIPLSVTLLGTTALSAMRPSNDSTQPTSYRKFVHRYNYTFQAILARKFSDRLSLALHPTYIHRNFVAAEDRNGIFATGIAGRLRITKMVGIIFDYFYLFPNGREVLGVQYHNPLGVGVEVKTARHSFAINFTNSSSILESHYIPSTSSDWLNGEFRFGFTISRTFPL